MECLPFVRRIANLRAYMIPESPGDFNRKVFLPKKRKQRRSTSDSSDSSVVSEQTTRSDLTLTESTPSQSSADACSVDSSDQYSTSTGGYMGDLPSFPYQRQTYSEQMSQNCDESTVFSLTNETDITITLADAEDFLGISIVGQNYSNGDCNLFVGAVLPGGAVSRDGRIQPGDLILAVNGQGLEGKSNKEAVSLLRHAVKTHSEVTLTIVGSWDTDSIYSDGSCVRPIDPLLWLAHNSLIHQSEETGLAKSPAAPHHRYPAMKYQTSIASSSLSSSMPSTAARFRSHSQQQALPLETPTDIIANRLRLHIIARNNLRQGTGQEGATPPRTTISMNGVELQMWLYKNIRGFKDLAEVANYATHMIASNYLKPASNYLQSGGHNSFNPHDLVFNRRENYIVNTRPLTPAIRPLTPVRQSSIRTSSAGSTLSTCLEMPTDTMQLLQNRRSSANRSVRRY